MGCGRVAGDRIGSIRRLRCMRTMRAHVRPKVGRGRSVTGHGRSRLTLKGQAYQQQYGEKAINELHIGNKSKPF